VFFSVLVDIPANVPSWVSSDYSRTAHRHLPRSARMPPRSTVMSRHDFMLHFARAFLAALIFVLTFKFRVSWCMQFLRL